MHLTEALLGSIALAGTTLAANHVVMVGKGGDITFTPPALQASKGDTVTFEFLDEHNVIQGDEDSPCMPMSGGFYSTTLEPDDKEMFQITINDTKPIYYYCSYDEHCKYGMVGVINAPASDQKKFAAAAMKASDVVTPKGDDEIGGSLIKMGSGSSSSGGGDDDDDDDGDDDGDMPSGSSGSMGSGSMSGGGGGDGGNSAAGLSAPFALAGLAATAIALFTL